MSELHVTVASWEDREDLVVELSVFDGTTSKEWGLVTFDAASGKAMLNLYPCPDGGEWRFSLDDVREILDRASRRIEEVAGPTPTQEPIERLPPGNESNGSTSKPRRPAAATSGGGSTA